MFVAAKSPFTGLIAHPIGCSPGSAIVAIGAVPPCAYFKICTAAKW